MTSAYNDIHAPTIHCMTGLNRDSLSRWFQTINAASPADITTFLKNVALLLNFQKSPKHPQSLTGSAIQR